MNLERYDQLRELGMTCTVTTLDNGDCFFVTRITDPAHHEYVDEFVRLTLSAAIIHAMNP